MSDRRLLIYLDDHVALMVAEVELISRCRRSNGVTPLGNFLQQLENEVQAQKTVVSDVIHRLGGKVTIEGRLKQGAAWVAEKVGRLKVNDSLLKYSELSRVIELETMAAAALERTVLWDTLGTVADNDSRLDGISFSFFRDQSQQHLDELNSRRQFAAAEAFARRGSRT